MKNFLTIALIVLLSALPGRASAQSGDLVARWNLATTGSVATQLSLGAVTPRGYMLPLMENLYLRPNK
jgi:hypothetical protein